jgi:hypothetical protein
MIYLKINFIRKKNTNLNKLIENFQDLRSEKKGEREKIKINNNFQNQRFF